MKFSPWVALAVGTFLLAAGAAVLVNQFGGEQVSAHVSAPVTQPVATATATATRPTPGAPAVTPSPAPSSSQPELAIPSVGLKAPLLQLKPTDGRVSPPSYADAFWLDGVGFGDVHQTVMPAAIAFHASTDPSAGALGDLIWDRTSQRSKVQPGDLVVADGVEFKVMRTLTQPKEGSDRRDPAWTSPGTLLVITCAEAPDAASTGQHADSNLVLVADRVS